MSEIVVWGRGEVDTKPPRGQHSQGSGGTAWWTVMRAAGEQARPATLTGAGSEPVGRGS